LWHCLLLRLRLWQWLWLLWELLVHHVRMQLEGDWLRPVRKHREREWTVLHHTWWRLRDWLLLR